MPLHGLRDLPVNWGMFGGMKRWGGETGEELKLSSGGSSGKHWGLAGGGQGLSETFICSGWSFHVECCSISCSVTLTPLPVLFLHAQMELHDLLKPISDHIQEIQNFRERNRGSSLFNHLSAISESIPALGWVAVVRKNATAHTKDTKRQQILHTENWNTDIFHLPVVYISLHLFSILIFLGSVTSYHQMKPNLFL